MLPERFQKGLRHKVKKLYLLLIIAGILLAALLFVRFVFGGDEDSWIKNEEGIWVKHGNPAETPDYVLEQQEEIECSLDPYGEKCLELSD